MSEISYYTKEGLEKLKNDLEFLVRKERSRIAKEINDARLKGDLSENAEYHAAKEAQGLLEIKIRKLKEVISKGRIIDKSLIDTSKVMILSKVMIENVQNGQQMAYTLVSESEADLKAGKISVSSPIGKGLLGKKVGDKAEIQVPAGKIEFKVVDISS